ncbi:BT4734/BF3469 family protein [Runella zeae]|uniref:BT4734/BF3469 family protein n=1 Tax=Runella zeae TaxID=94255 RepID=UPI0003F9EC63|nr:BT4734/BF3469 family protein [Runella zeae]
MSILDRAVSIFANYNTPHNPKTVTIRQFLTSTKYRDKVEYIRALKTKPERDIIKATLPAITPSGVFTYRASKNLVEHSGLICLDIDYKGNESIGNFDDLKEQLVKIPNIAFCIKSVSGMGYAVGIPIRYPDKHVLHFEALKKIFLQYLEINIDAACRDVTRLRGYTYDDSVYLNDKAVPFEGLDTPILHTPKQVLIQYDWNKFDPLQVCHKIIKNSVDGERHNNLLKASKLAGGYIASGLLDEDKAIVALNEYNQIYNQASHKPTYKPLKTICDGIEYGKQTPIPPSKSSSFFEPIPYPHQWNELPPKDYVPTWKEYTPQSLGLKEATTPPLTEKDLIELLSGKT